MKVDFESMRQRYKPEIIKFLFIAEAPTKKKKFFYYDGINQTVSPLFREIMKVVYPSDYSNIKDVRQQKGKFLERFKNDGFYLIDASNKPMIDNCKSKKKKQIKESLPSLIERVKGLISKDTNIILISKTVYDICYESLRAEGFNVINKETIPFPSHGWQKEFRRKLSLLLKR
jgi:hypothetical protein